MSDPDATPIADLIATMTEAAADASSLPADSQILLRLAALVALDASPASYLFHMAVAGEVGLTADDAQQVLITLAPVVGTARTVSAATKMTRALGLALAIGDALDES